MTKTDSADEAGKPTLADYGWRQHFQAQLNDDDAGSIAVRIVGEHRDALDAVGPAFSGRIAAFSQGNGNEDRATVGDWLMIDGATKRPLRLLERHSVFSRKSAGTGRGVQLIAANVDTLLVVTSANQDFNLARLERYLALALGAGALPIIIITKADLTIDIDAYITAARALKPGLMVEAIDARRGDIDRVLAPWLGRGQTLALLGSSGVGKSTLINSFLGTATQATQGIRDDDAKGRHTTSGRSLHRLASGAWLMDTPGIRELQLVDVAGGIAEVFDDIAALAAQCKFSDCTHASEPGCAIVAALADGTLESKRFKRYQKLRREEKNSTLSIAEARARGRRFGKMAKRVFAEKLKSRGE